MEQKKTSVLYRIIKWLVWFFYPRLEVVGAENLPADAAIIVGNHTQMNGPIAAELYCPGKHYTWCAGQMMHLKDVPGYAFQDFWSQKPKWTHPFYKVLSYLIAPLSVCVFNNANTIGVYRDTRIVGTFKNTVKRLQEGNHVVIFPEHDVKYNHILYDFQDKFIDVAKLYYKKTGKELQFVPLYIAPKLKKMYFGKPTQFCAANPMEEERRRICDYLMKEITEIACSLPEHTVVPYRNIPKKYYPTNIPKEETMKPPAIDYRKLRLNNLNTPEYRHLLLLLGWVGYLLLYVLTENLIPAEACFPVHCRLDDVVPFCEWFIIPYVSWYLLIVGSLLYFLLYSVDSFQKMQTYIIITQIIAMVVYIAFPNRQDLRPEVFPRDNILTQLIGFIYSVDTNTGVCPSLHVGYSLGIASTWLREKSVPKWLRVAIAVWCGVICISVAFVKQHSVADIFAAIPMCLAAEWFVFFRKKDKGV